MDPETQEVFVFAHKTNIQRYRRTLETYLTTEERRFVERRIAEEEAALQQIAGSLSHSA